MKKLIFFFFLSLLSKILFSQAFPIEPDKFLKSFTSELGYTGEVRKNSKSLAKEFTNFWESDSLSFQEKEKFIQTANDLAAKGCKAYPDFVCLADNKLWFTRKGFDNSQYEIYEKGIFDILNAGKRPKLNDLSNYFLSFNALLSKDILAKNPRTYWKLENNSFKLIYDKGIKIQLSKVNLIGYQGVDSLKIYRTDCEYYPSQNLLKGNGGTIGWERVGYGLDSIQAKLSDYEINTKNISLTADSVSFNNTMYIKKPMLGKLIDKAGNLDNPKKSDYPKFTSYNQHYELKNLVPGIDYEGGFSVQGNSFIASGTKEEPATMLLTKSDSIYMKAKSLAFYLDTEIIISDNCAINIHFNEDSIYHPQLTFKYHIHPRFLELIRSKNDMSKVNYINSYHQINMDFTWLKWFIDKYKIEFTTIKTSGVDNEALFESADYFRLERYRDIQKKDAQHPLAVVTNFVDSFWGNNNFYLNDLAKWMQFSPQQVVQMVLDLAYRGFLNYDPLSQEIMVYPDAWTFLQAYQNKKDSDVIQFHSITKNDISNAELSLINFDLKINGIYEAHLSDSQNIKVYPLDRKITLQKNRTFTFDGTIQAGQFYFYGSNFKFDYNRFMIELNQCDSMKMVAETDYLDENGNYKLAIVRNKLEQINGAFYIDEPMNKSGRGNFPEFPRLISNDKTYVYYDRPDVYNGIYKRNEFYFEVDPFELDSIKGYSRDNLLFKGTLYSADIFPPIKETLVLRKNDFSLGFNTRTGPVGLPLYSGKATFWNEIDLSNQGLRGSGRIEYLSANMNPDYLIFFPKFMEGHSPNFEIKKQTAPVEYPEVIGRDNTLRWNVEEDDFMIKRDTSNFTMYEGKGSLEGNLNLKTSGLWGDGTMFIDRAKISSNLINFKKDVFDADTASFDIYTINVLNIDFKSDNVKSHIDFINRKGVFKSNGEKTIWTFPKNKYMSEMNEMTWFMDNDELAISADTDVLEKLEKEGENLEPDEWESLFLEGPKFTSLHPKQDSLYFVAPNARYNYKDHIIYAEGVKFIKVADATIYTEDGNVTIEKDAVMQTIQNAKIVANSTSRYHIIYNAAVNIYGRKNYNAFGDYDFINSTKQAQTIHLTKVAVDASGQTYGTGTIIEPDNFTINPYFRYQGDVSLYANNPELEFNGAAKTIDDCDTTDFGWVKFKSFIDPEDVFIKIDSISYNINNTRLCSGLVLSNTNQIYPAFLTRKRNQYDQEIFTANGYLHYDQDEGKFVIASKDKIAENSLPGNLIRKHKSICNVYGEGKFEFSKDFGLFKPNAIGNFMYYPDLDTAEINVSMIIDAYFSNTALKAIGEKINTIGGLSGLNLRDDVFEKALIEFLGTNKADEWFSNQSLGNYNKFPKELENKLIFTDLQLYWHKQINSFVHYGPIGIANLGKEQINKYIFGFIRIEKSRRGDIFEILLEPDYSTWYYFRYSAGTFSVISSDENFNNIVYNQKPNQREKTENGVFYQYGLGSSTYMKRFKKDMYKFFKIDDEIED
ncbi:MAG: hypothetical protein M0P36_03370 [Bacteroidales bacterium]|nr:hypothetical protein [Bacteroidales bacterium]